MKRLVSLCLLLSGVAFAEPSESEVPLYGGPRKPLTDRNPPFSNDAAKQGWKALDQGDLDTAHKRFSQAWLLDAENAEAYWGLGVVMGRRASQDRPQKHLEESIRLLKLANAKAPENGRILGDLAFSYTVLGHFFVSQGESGKASFESAGPLFAKAFQLDPKYPPTLANWSIYYFYINDYPSAKKKASEAEALGFKLDPNYLSELNQKLR